MDWCKRRGIAVSKTAGDEPQSNGRAEVSVKEPNLWFGRHSLKVELDQSGGRGL